jgi:hypothetical protein
MDQIGDIILTLKITELKAQIALREIERVGLNRVTEDLKTDEDSRYRATILRERVTIEWGELMTELHELCEVHEEELEIRPRATLN